MARLKQIAGTERSTADRMMKSHCRVCAEKPTCEAHIIPQAFARLIRRFNDHVREIKVSGSRKAKRQNGIFDRDILCSDCDAKIGQFDDYAYCYIRNFILPPVNRSYEIIDLSGLEVERMIRFAVSVIYKASISSMPQFASVTLGKYEADAERIVFDGLSEGTVARLHVQVAILRSTDLDMRSHIALPIAVRNETGPYHLFTVAGFQFLVRFGAIPFCRSGDRKFAQRLSLRPGRSAHAAVYPFEKSGDYVFLRQAGRNEVSARLP